MPKRTLIQNEPIEDKPDPTKPTQKLIIPKPSRPDAQVEILVPELSTEVCELIYGVKVAVQNNMRRNIRVMVIFTEV